MASFMQYIARRLLVCEFPFYGENDKSSFENATIKIWFPSRGGGGYITINTYGGVRRKDFVTTQSQKFGPILIPNPRIYVRY